MRASASEEALARPSGLSSSLSNAIADPNFNLKLRAGDVEEGRWRVISYLILLF